MCSPVEEDEKTLVKLAKKMKKNNVSIDFVLFGDLEDDSTQRKLQAFIDNVKGQRDSSNLVVIPPSGKLLSDQLLTTPILGEAGAAAAAAAAAAHGVGDGGEFGDLGFDPSVDPELALALRMSMEEERARQERVARQEAEAAARAALETVQEEAGESSAAGAPQAGGSGSADSAAPEKKDDKGKDDKQPEGGERMDTS